MAADKKNRRGQHYKNARKSTFQKHRRQLRLKYEKVSQELHKLETKATNGFYDPNHGKNVAKRLAKGEPRCWNPAILFWETNLANARRELALNQGAAVNDDPYDIVATIASDDEAIMEVIYDVSEDDTEGGGL